MTPHELDEWIKRGVLALERIAAALEQPTVTNTAEPLVIYGGTNDVLTNVPGGIFWSEAKDAFFASNGQELPIHFYKAWFDRRAEFPPAPYYVKPEPVSVKHQCPNLPNVFCECEPGKCNRRDKPTRWE